MMSQPSYVWDAEQKLLRLEASDLHPEFARIVSPGPGLVAHVQAEIARRDAEVQAFKAEGERLVRAVEAAKERVTEAEQRLRASSRVRWVEGSHAFEVWIPNPSLDVPGLPENLLRTKQLVECSEIHCALRVRVFELSQADLDRVGAFFRVLKDGIATASAQLRGLQQQLAGTERVLGSARRRNTEPIRLAASTVTGLASVPHFVVRPIPSSTARGAVF